MTSCRAFACEYSALAGIFHGEDPCGLTRNPVTLVMNIAARFITKVTGFPVELE